MYSKFTNLSVVRPGAAKKNFKLKPFHHIRLDREFKLDCMIWQTFFTHYRELTLCRPMVNLNSFETARDLGFSSDTSANPLFGIGAVFQHRWLFTQWEPGYIKKYNPSIEYLELYAVVTTLLTWGQYLKNIRLLIHCVNSAVVGMLNSMSSTCKNCMFLLRSLTLNNLVHNRCVFARHISSEDNFLSDVLSCLQFKHFWRLVPEIGMDKEPTKLSPLVWPASSIWQRFD